MDDSSAIGGISIATLLTAIGWLAKRLYDAPRQHELDRLIVECDAIKVERDRLRAAADEAIVEAKRLYDAREVELRDLRAQLDELRFGIETAERRGGARRRADH